MKERVRASLVQLDCEVLDRDTNVKRIVAAIEAEGERGCDLVAFPELASTGYLPSAPDAGFGARLREQADRIPSPATEAIGAAAARNSVYAVVGMAELGAGDELYNSAVLFGPDGSVVGSYRKLHLALNEKDFFAAGDEIPTFETELGRIALNVCYDVRFPELARVQALDGAELLVSIWAMWEQPGLAAKDSIAVRCRSRATENFVYVLGCNRRGRDGDRAFFGGSVVAAPNGELLAGAGAGDEVVRATLSSEPLERQREYLTVFSDRRPELYGRLVEPN